MAKSLLVFCCVLVAAASISAQEPAPPLPSCSTNISSCGCVIKKTGIYTVQDNLNANQTSAPNCIEIAASVAVELDGTVHVGNKLNDVGERSYALEIASYAAMNSNYMQ